LQNFGSQQFYSNPVVANKNHDAKPDAANIDNRLTRQDFNLTVTGPTCSAPTTPGVNVCAPATDNSVAISSPVQVTAAATIIGTLNRMEIWVDGVKEFTETTSLNFNTTVGLAAGSHRFDIYAVNNAGTKYETTIYATVN
jgi:hypothetical protein